MHGTGLIMKINVWNMIIENVRIEKYCYQLSNYCYKFYYICSKDYIVLSRLKSNVRCLLFLLHIVPHIF